MKGIEATGMTIAHMPYPHLHVEWARKASATIVPINRVGMALILSGNDNQNPRFRRVVKSDMKTC